MFTSRSSLHEENLSRVEGYLRLPELTWASHFSYISDRKMTHLAFHGSNTFYLPAGRDSVKARQPMYARACFMYFTPRILDFGTGIEEMKAINYWMMFGVKYLFVISTKPWEQNFVGFSLGFLYLVFLVSFFKGKALGTRLILITC